MSEECGMELRTTDGEYFTCTLPYHHTGDCDDPARWEMDCSECGARVRDSDQHARWHDMLTKALRAAGVIITKIDA